jgi:GNAT superfamily N-acetyltransferase
MLDNSLCFGLYDTLGPQPPANPDDAESRDASNPNLDTQGKLIGFARLITDTVTFAYLTDVYVLNAYQGLGLGKWLVRCVAECVDDEAMPWLRRVLAVMGDRGMEGFYQREMGLSVLRIGRLESDVGGSDGKETSGRGMWFIGRVGKGMGEGMHS